MVVLVDGVEYRLIRPDNEQALEDAVKLNHTYIFGHDSLYFDLKRKMKSTAGVATIPDGYVILFDPKPRWCIVEVELSSHPLYDHVVAQLTKFNRAIENTGTRRQIIEHLYEAIRSDIVLEAQVKQRIKSGEIYKFVSDVISEDPIIVIVIDEETGEVGEALRDIGGDKRVVEFRTYQRAGVTDSVYAYVFTPPVERTRSREEHRTIGAQAVHAWQQGGRDTRGTSIWLGTDEYLQREGIPRGSQRWPDKIRWPTLQIAKRCRRGGNPQHRFSSRDRGWLAMVEVR